MSPNGRNPGFISAGIDSNTKRKERAMNTKRIDNTEDIIDSRDIIARITDLETDENNLDEYDKEELTNLRTLVEDASSSSDWQYGETLIRDSHFEEYAREFAQETGAINFNIQWPYTCINWGQATRELQMDYMSVDFDGIEYWIRA